MTLVDKQVSLWNRQRLPGHVHSSKTPPLAQEKLPTVTIRDVSILVSLCPIHHVLGYMIVSLPEARSD